jgi:hypothetical protein
MPFIFMFAGNALMFIEKVIKRHGKTLATLIVIALLLGGGYMQLTHADSIIKAKKDSYSEVRDAGLWMKENTSPGDVIASVSAPQTIYYSEREVANYANLNSKEEFESFLEENNPKYLTVSVFEPVIFDERLRWFHEWIEENQGTRIKDAKAYTSGDRPILVIYEIQQGNV